jgi:hypothetical protein
MTEERSVCGRIFGKKSFLYAIKMEIKTTEAAPTDNFVDDDAVMIFV